MQAEPRCAADYFDATPAAGKNSRCVDFPIDEHAKDDENSIRFGFNSLSDFDKLSFPTSFDFRFIGARWRADGRR